MLLRILPVFGALLLGLGGYLLVSDAGAREVLRVETLVSAEPHSLPKLADGSGVLLAGRLVAREPVEPHGFVVYRKESYLRTETEGASKGKEQWQSLSVPTPLIAVERDGVRVEVCNRDYVMGNRPHRFQSEVIPAWRSVGDATIRLSGFKEGDELSVDGSVVDGGRCFRAKSIFSGDRGAYLEAARQGVVVYKVVGAVFVALGGLALGAGLWLRRRLARPR